MTRQNGTGHILGIVAIVGLSLLLAGCSSDSASFINPSGPIAEAQRWHLIKVTLLTLIAVLPVILLVPFILWRYRYKNKRARYLPNWEFSAPLEIAMWGVPFLLIVIISTQLWQSTKELDPYRPIGGDKPPIEVQVVGLDWKWLFIYPEQQIATVGELAFPAGRPVSLALTTDTVMQSFMVPALAGQIYAMPGMITKLHFSAPAPGTFFGENTQFNGTGFTGQKFAAKAMSEVDFESWVGQVKSTGLPLDQKAYATLGKRGTRAEAVAALGANGMPSGVLYFNSVDPAMFRQILHKYHSGAPVPPAAQPGAKDYLAEGELMKGDLWSAIFGRLGPNSFPFTAAFENPTTSDLIAAGAAAVVVIGGLVAFLLITWLRKWDILWRDWLTSTDHKRIGIMYIVLSLVMLARGVIEGALMRSQQAFGLTGGFLTPDHFSELFSTHGTIMIFFVAMPFVAGFINYIMPLQIGARDVSFPVMNQISLALTTVGAALVMISLVIGKFSTGGWTAYPPYTGADFNPGPGPDYWIWAIVIAGFGSTLSGINFAVTIYKERAPGMNLMQMPLFCWTVLCTAIILIFAMPPLTVASLMLGLDRYLDFHFFTNDLGGNMMNYANLFWLFGHPEVYLLVLPAYGIYSEVVSTYSGKTLYGYTSLVLATMSIAVLSFTVWLHHFFTMGQAANINIAFGIASMLIAVPTGVKVYDWMATMFRGRIRMSVPMVYTTGFFILFVIGGLTGVILANPTIDYQVHNTLFLVAHFHNVLIPGVLFAMLAALNYWFPKAFGFRLDEKWGYISALLWIFGFAFTFFPLYVVGLQGMPRRSFSFSDPAFEPMMIVALFGACLILSALGALCIQFWVSIRDRDSRRVFAGDPWNGRSLEWAISAPPPEYNFAVLPTVKGRDAFTLAKENGYAYQSPQEYEDIELPRSTPIGMIFCVGGILLSMALIWYIWWLAILSLLAMAVAFIARSFRTDLTETIPAAEIEKEHRAWLDAVAKTPPVTRAAEDAAENQGRAAIERPETEGAV
ncbi:MAG: hypothetical protein EP348_11005 [Alphaproteobacteria bacterium]|nr:MAG: hypothetical protein EP348_11005 [Alphaproteobacteria bacterium]